MRTVEVQEAAVRQLDLGRIGLAAMLAVMLGGCNPDRSSAAEVLPNAPAETDLAAESAPGGALPTDDVILQTVLDQVDRLNLCDGFYQPEVATAESQVYRLSDRALVELHCAMAAYR